MVQAGAASSDSGDADALAPLQVRVTFVGLVQRVVGRREVLLSLPASATLRDLLDELASRFGPELEERLLDQGVLAPQATVLIGGRNALRLGGLDAPLGPGRAVGEAPTSVEIVLLGPPVMGG